MQNSIYLLSKYAMLNLKTQFVLKHIPKTFSINFGKVWPNFKLLKKIIGCLESLNVNK